MRAVVQVDRRAVAGALLDDCAVRVAAQLAAVQETDVLGRQRDAGVVRADEERIGVRRVAVERDVAERDVAGLELEHGRAPGPRVDDVAVRRDRRGRDRIARAVDDEILLGDRLRPREVHDVRHQRHRVAGLLRPRDGVCERRVDRRLVRRTSQARFRRTDVGHAHLVVPDELGRVAGGLPLVIDEDHGNARLVLRRIDSVRRVPDDDRRAGSRLLCRHLDRHVRHRNARTDLDRLRDIGQIQHQRIVLRAEDDVLDQARVVRVLNRAGERVAVAVHREVRVRETERVRQDRVRQEAHLDRRRALVKPLVADGRGDVHDLLAVVDDVVPRARRGAGERVRRPVAQREGVRDEARGHLHVVEDALHLVERDHPDHADEQQVVADVDVRRVVRVLRQLERDRGAALRQDAREREHAAVRPARAGVESVGDDELRTVVEVDARAVAGTLLDDRAVRVAGQFAAVEQAHVRGRQLRAGIVRAHEIRVAVRGVAVERDVPERHLALNLQHRRAAHKRIEHVAVPVRRNRRSRYRMTRSVERQRLVDRLRAREVRDVRQQLHLVAVLRGINGVRQRLVLRDHLAVAHNLRDVRSRPHRVESGIGIRTRRDESVRAVFFRHF